MAKGTKSTPSSSEQLDKCLTGIKGIDEITHGGLPQNRSTLVVGSAGSGKTLLGMQFLINGIKSKEPGLFVSFEETEQDLIKNCLSLGFNLNEKIKSKQLVVQHIHIDRSEFDESGSYNLEGLFIRIGYLINKHKIKRVVIDTIEVLFNHLDNTSIIRSELERLFRWLSTKNVTSIITGEQGQNTISRHGLEEYVADCVILLDNRVINELATRYLRILKYRGSSHGSNEFPFIIDYQGITLSPVTSISLDFIVPNSFVSTGIKALDEVLSGNGYYVGGSILINGSAGTGKTSLAATFVDSQCKSGKKCIYFAFEESSDQIIRNMKSININLERWKNKGKLLFQAIRPSIYGLESHLIKMVQLIQEFKPDSVVIDPISNLNLIGSQYSVKLMLTRLINFLKMNQITTIMTSLLHEDSFEKQIGISSLMDTWIFLDNVEIDLEQNTLLIVKKSRGMAHSHQMREFNITKNGIILNEVYMGAGKIVVGSSRLVQAMQDEIQDILKTQEFTQKMHQLKDKQRKVESDINALNDQLNNIKDDIQTLDSNQKHIKQITDEGIKKIRKTRTLLPQSAGKREN
ncbi:circadian clock protein KaiC [Legionella bononiensis]|uniref:non-specific serine/threonine protein kinase n=1 Tax=Legionella bononiensis TaxID=2793102 RepID=A0ABS1WAJ5_9GAMM|nr:circadian clock protein KaiC [Legionella bononiensis]MBL7480387.1 circadian clock protein KaiC [Legionella bononiensis]MBL7526381.1 circadian clock protein KaiC [Legionella bononiensis]MBL7563125.1 circadian clock protein KaiC [Legionella bononiensis]